MELINLTTLGRVAYEEHIRNSRSKPDDYFQSEVIEDNLPAHTKEH